MAFSSLSVQAQNENLRPLLNRNIPLISGKYGLRNHFWPLESGFLVRKSEEKGQNFLALSAGKFTYSESSHQIQQPGYNRIFAYFCRAKNDFRTHVKYHTVSKSITFANPAMICLSGEWMSTPVQEERTGWLTTVFFPTCASNPQMSASLTDVLVYWLFVAPRDGPCLSFL